jgi:hypothetical protein
MPLVGGLLIGLLCGMPSTMQGQRTHLLVVAGLSGAPEFRARFDSAARALGTAATQRWGVRDSSLILLGEDSVRTAGYTGRSTREQVGYAFVQLSRQVQPGDLLLVVLMGHGSGEGAQSKGSLPVIDQNAHPIVMGVEDQIGPAIPGHIGGGYTRHITAERFQSLREGLVGDVLKAPLAPVAPQRGTAPGGSKEHIQPSIPIHISQSDPRPVEQQLVGKVSCSRNRVGEGDASSGGFEAQETHPTRRFLRQERRSHPAGDQPNNPSAPRFRDGSTAGYGPRIHAFEERGCAKSIVTAHPPSQAHGSESVRFR